MHRIDKTIVIDARRYGPSWSDLRRKRSSGTWTSTGTARWRSSRRSSNGAGLN